MIRKEIAKDNIKLIHNDCLAELSAISTESADVFVTSPPYNIGMKYNTYKDNLDFTKYLNWLFQIGEQIKRILKPDGSFFLNIGSTNTSPYIAMNVAIKMQELFVLQNNIVWVKSIAINNDTFGHFKPINSKRYLNHNHESIFHFTKNGDNVIDRLAIGVPYKHKSNVTRWKHEGEAKDLRCAGNTWFIPYVTVQSKNEKFNHPAGYPEELAERCIKLHGKDNPVVIDPFLGAGTTLKVCQKLKCVGIGIEIDEFYFNVAASRLGYL